MGQYRTPIRTGDRVALAPHTDLWMGGARFGTVTANRRNREGAIYYRVQFTSTISYWMAAGDLLGAVAGTPVGAEQAEQSFGERYEQDREAGGYPDANPRDYYDEMDRDMRGALEGWGQ